MHHSLIRGCKHNSSHHPIHPCAHPRLDLCGVGSGVAVDLGVSARVSCGVLLGVADDVDACMDGPAFDGIRVASNSLIQSFSEYHHNSCARLTALQNSRVERGPQGRGGTKRAATGSLRQVGLSAGKKRSISQQQSRKLHEEMWASLLDKQGPLIFQEVEIIPECAVLVARPSCPDHSPEPPGPGRKIRNMLGWSQMEKTVRSGVRLFRGALQGESLFSSLVAAGDWVRKGSYHTAWSVPCSSFCTCSYLYGRGPTIGPCSGKRCWPLLAGVWRAIAPLMRPWCAEGEVPNAVNLNLYRGWRSCVGWHCDDEPLFGEGGDAKLIVSVSLGSSAVFRWRRQSCPDDEGHVGLAIVTSLSWMANARTSSFIVRILVGNRNG